MKKNEVGYLPHTVCKINSKLVRDLNLIPNTIKLFLEENREKVPWLWIWQEFPGYETKSTGNKGKNRQIELYLKLLCIK